MNQSLAATLHLLTNHTETEQFSAAVIQSKAINSFQVVLEVGVRVRVTVGKLYMYVRVYGHTHVYR